MERTCFVTHCTFITSAFVEPAYFSDYKIGNKMYHNGKMQTDGFIESFFTQAQNT